MDVAQIVGWVILLVILIGGAIIKHKTRGFLQDIDGARGVVVVDKTKRSKVIADISD